MLLKSKAFNVGFNQPLQRRLALYKLWRKPNYGKPFNKITAFISCYGELNKFLNKNYDSVDYSYFIEINSLNQGSKYYHSLSQNHSYDNESIAKWFMHNKYQQMLDGYFLASAHLTYKMGVIKNSTNEIVHKIEVDHNNKYTIV